MERLREELGIDRWVVFGGSWGSTLGLANSPTEEQLEQFFNEGEFGAALAGATNAGAAKTLAQVDVYQCNPLRPGLFLRVGGGAAAENEYFEGSTIRFEFRRIHPQAGPAATVSIGSP